ncbi:MAG: dihydrodipicolinate synthase family protein [Chloroflexi bacterium]|nr:dihydrodipicolinate synthase family protein [Chloroflexota bacterium]
MIPTDPIVVAPMPTPFDADDQVDYAAIERNTQRWLETPLSGFVLNSENGEESFLDEAERIQIVKTVSAVASGQKVIVGGVDSPSVTDTIRKANELVAAGADLVRIRIPRLTDDFEGYFEQVLPRVDAPVLIIHQPAPGMFAQTQTIGTPESVAGLIGLPNVFAYLASGNIRFETMVRHYMPSDSRFWIGNGVLLLAGAALEANGACLMFANIGPSQCHDIVRMGMNADIAGARAVHRELVDVDYTILARGAAGIKAALNLQGYEMSVPRRPSTAFSEAEIADLKAKMERAGLI